MGLQIDGDGTGDDWKLNMLLKALIKWCGAKDDQNTIELQYQRMQTQLGWIELNMTKSRMAAAMNQDELENYEQLHHKVEYKNYLKFKEVKAAV